MDCTVARDGLLEAEVEELRGDGDSALARHLRACATCRAAAERILAAYAALDASLAVERPRRRMPRTLRWLEVAVPLAAAAILVLVLAQPSVHIPAAPAASATSAASAAPLVSAPAAHDVTVMHTDDPNIVIVWIN
ncbi:MAG TPA: hypothetical protein VJ992_02285 [Gemmatimonadales bacterium]|nr:hypothetical protein [Gemmatimonadales bacterium]